MSYLLGEPTVQQYFDANGDPLASGTIEFYLAGTSTPTPIYSDSAGTSLGTSVTLNSIGAPQSGGGTAVALFFDTNIIYKIARKDSAGTAIAPTIEPFYPDGIVGVSVEPSFSEAYAASHISIDSITTVSFFPSWEGTTTGPKGGATYHRDGTTGTASTAYSDNSGFYDTNGDGFSLAKDGEFNVYQFGGVDDDSTINTTPVQNALNYLTADKGGIVTVPRYCNFDLSLLTMPKRATLKYFAGDDVSDRAGNAAATNELMVLQANANSGGIVNEQRLVATFHPGHIVEVRKDLDIHDSFLGAGQTRLAPVRASYNILDEGYDRFRTVYQNHNERTAFSGVSQHAWLQRVTLAGITTASFSVAPVESDIVTGSTSGAIGLVQSIDGSELVVRWFSGTFEAGETVVNNRGTIASPTNEASSTTISTVTHSTLTGQSLTADFIRGYWGVGLPPEVCKSHWTVGGRSAVTKTRGGGQYEYETVSHPSRAWVDSYENATPAGFEVVYDTTAAAASRRLTLRKLGESGDRARGYGNALDVNFSNSALISTSAFNVATLSRTGTGIYEIVPTVDFVRADMTVALGNSSISDFSRVYSKATNKVIIRNYNSSWVLADLVGSVEVIVSGGDI